MLRGSKHCSIWQDGRDRAELVQDRGAPAFAPLGSEALSLADPMGPPPSVITGRGNGPKGTPGPLDLSSSTAPWRATDEGPAQDVPVWLLAPA